MQAALRQRGIEFREDVVVAVLRAREFNAKITIKALKKLASLLKKRKGNSIVAADVQDELLAGIHQFDPRMKTRDGKRRLTPGPWVPPAA